MFPDRSHTVAFTGHRTYRDQAADLLPVTLEALYRRGYRRFMSGMAVGFDLAAAEAVAELRSRHADVKLICVIPFPDHPKRFAPEARQRYERLTAGADERVFVNERYAPDCYARRNDYLVDNASYVVAYLDGGSRGGTSYTVRRAHRQHLPVENLHPDKQLNLQF